MSGLLLIADRLRGCEGGDCGGRWLWRRAGQPWKQGDTAESCVGGGTITVTSLCPHRPASAAEIIEKLAHKTPDTMNYRVGPQPGGPHFVSDVPNNREGPQAREPSKCRIGQSYRGRLVKEAF